MNKGELFWEELKAFTLEANRSTVLLPSLLLRALRASVVHLKCGFQVDAHPITAFHPDVVGRKWRAHVKPQAPSVV